LHILLNNLFYIGIDLESHEFNNNDKSIEKIIDKHLMVKNKPTVTASLKTFFINSQKYLNKFTSDDYKVIFWIVNNVKKYNKKFQRNFDEMLKEFENVNMNDVKQKLRTSTTAKSVNYENMQFKLPKTRKSKSEKKIEDKQNLISPIKTLFENNINNNNNNNNDNNNNFIINNNNKGLIKTITDKSIAENGISSKIIVNDDVENTDDVEEDIFNKVFLK
jgi:hypothetical protein